MRLTLVGTMLLAICFVAAAQDSSTASSEKRVALTEKAVALDGSGAPALEGNLKTTALNGSEDSPVTNISLVVKNSSGVPYLYVSGLVTFYDSAGVRCGEGVFKADSLSVDEAFETDTPGIRIRCTPSSWRIVTNNLIPKVAPLVIVPPSASTSRNLNLVISVDGEEHPIQLQKPMVVKLGDAQRTIVLREAP
ncbi:MAG: hypothetical protein ABJC10_08005 [Acidobacteriota bacterium]